MTALGSGSTRVVGAGLIPVALAAAWIPWRDQLPNVDLALALVVAIAAVGWMAGSRAALLSAMVAAVAFDVLDTRPYGALTMSRGVDITTALMLVATGVLVGAGAARLSRYRKTDDRRSDALAIVMEASRLAATGEEQKLVTEALRAELVRALALETCTFYPQPPSGTRPSVARDGNLVGLINGPGGKGPAAQIDLPIWRQGDVIAHYRLTVGARHPSPEELRVALSLADLAGAAMTLGDDEPPPPPGDGGQLRLLPPTPRQVLS